MKRFILKFLFFMRTICILFMTFFGVVFYLNVNAQVYQAYKKLTPSEQHWVLKHPFAAKKVYNISMIATKETQKHLKDKDLDGDGTGGTLDAFRHTLWMALCSQKIGKRRSLLLGQAHEDGNRYQFEKSNGKFIAQDSVLSKMDLLNNEQGAILGEKYPKATFDETVELVKQAILKGQCWKVKKNSKRQYLDKDGNIIDLSLYKGVWSIPKVLIRSDE